MKLPGAVEVEDSVEGAGVSKSRKNTYNNTATQFDNLLIKNLIGGIRQSWPNLSDLLIPRREEVTLSATRGQIRSPWVGDIVGGQLEDACISLL